jgi:hypothetical protein
MKQRQIKILGIMLCLLILGTLVPAVGAVNQKNTTVEPQTMFGLAMVMGRLSNVHKIGRFVIAYAIRLHYLGIGMKGNFDMGVVRGHEVIFRDSHRFHMMPIGMNIMVFGRVQRLRILL